MAKQLNYTHPNGTVYNESYWRITALAVDVPRRYARFVFTGYKDAQARLDGKEPIGIRLLELREGIFDSYFTEVVLKTKNPQEVGYDYCTQFLDIPAVEIQVDENGAETEVIVNRSFFDGSIDC